MKLRRLAISLIALTVLVAACGDSGGDTTTTGAPVATDAPTATEGTQAGPAVEDLEIGMVLMAQNTGFFNTAACGAELAAEELGLSLDIQAPADFDAVEQVAVLEAVVARRPDGILMAPHDRTLLIAPMQEASEVGITLVEFDAVVDDPSLSAAKLQTDNVDGGRIGARALAELIGEEGKVLLIDFRAGTESTDSRAQGFEEEIANFPNIEYLGIQYAENDPAKAAEIIAATVAANPDLAGVFVTTGAGSDGTATALREQDARPQVALVGFDADPALVEQLRNGFIDAIVTQQPFQMGYQGVYQLVNALTGQPVTDRVDTGTIVVTADNVDDPATQGGQYALECVGGPAAAPAGPAVEDLEIGMVLMAQNTGFFNTAACGAELAAEELGLSLDIQAPADFDAVEQVAVLEAVVARRPDGILMAPHDRTLLIAPMQEASEVGITLVEFDAVVDDPSLSAAKLQTDNVDGGRIGARALAELIGEEGKVLLIDFRAGTESTDSRAQGFEEEIANFPNIEYLGIQYAENDPAKAAEIIAATVAANPDLAGVFVTTGAGSDGTATALREQDARPQVALVGFDADPALVEQLRNGFIDAIVTQQPFQMGYQGVYQLVNALTGQPVTDRVDTGTIVVTADNVDDPATQGGQYALECG